jgi:hypothetical protein
VAQGITAYITMTIDDTLVCEKGQLKSEIQKVQVVQNDLRIF